MSKKDGDSLDALCFPNAEDYQNDFDTANQILLGSGSYGQVYKMTFKSNPSQSCAVKIVQCINKKSYDQALKEVQLNRQINIHPNIIYFDKIYAWSETIPVQKYFLVFQMKLAKGSLKDLKEDEIKASRKTFSELSFLNIVNQLLQAFLFLQQKELYHRDIKPENILYDKENEKIIARIADFGVSKALEHFKTNFKNTLVGTPLYLSPKLWEAYINGQYNDVKHNLEKSDVFSLGVTMIQTYLLLQDQDIAGLNDLKQNKVPNLLQQIYHDKIKELLTGMLNYDEKSRFTWQQAINCFNGVDKINGSLEQNQGGSLQNREKHYALHIPYEKTITNKSQSIKLRKINQIYCLELNEITKGQITDDQSIIVFSDNYLIQINFDGQIIYKKQIQNLKSVCFTEQPRKIIGLFENNTIQVLDDDISQPFSLPQASQQINVICQMREANVLIGLGNGQVQVLQFDKTFKVLNTLKDHTAQINLIYFDKLNQLLITSDYSRILSVRFLFSNQFSYLKLDYIAQHVELLNDTQIVVNGQKLNEILILNISYLQKEHGMKLEIKQTLSIQTGCVLSLINLSEKCLFVSTEKEIIIYDLQSIQQDTGHLYNNEMQQTFYYCNWIRDRGYLITNDGQRIIKWEIDYEKNQLFGTNRIIKPQTKKCCCCESCSIM
ncbi:unnamed protein product [Paramecium primaurelia]|uniref:non-specific serine/threonine protein kinase n=1 Tax=Paramecium primaurelia TaxID=5886 RepID=A0A8S1NFZ5_PARPR|nr:unnamed protein product [Paramecium primaurelia]